MDKLVFDAFPRTGSTFLMHALRAAFPNKDVTMRMHQMTPLKEAPFAVTTARHPLECVPSCLNISSEFTASEVLDWYVQFMEVILANLDTLYVVFFENLIKDVNIEMNNISTKFNLEKPVYIDASILNKNSSPYQYTKAVDIVKNDPKYNLALTRYLEVKEKATY